MADEQAPTTIIKLPFLVEARDHLIGNVVLGFIGTVCIGLRLYGRHFSIGYGWDDFLIVLGWIFSVSLLVEQGILGPMGDGYDFDPEAWYFPALLNNLETFIKIILSYQLLYMMSLTLIKCSVLAFYKRVFVSDSMKKLTTITFIFVVLWCIGHSFTMIFICTPVSAWWDLNTTGSCKNQVPIYVSLIITNILSDIAIMVLPMGTIWELKMKKTEKLALTAAFALGIASVAVAICRLVTVFSLDPATNLTGTVELAVFLCTLETVLALLCVNIPLLRPLYRRFIVRQSSSKIDDSGKNYGTGYASQRSAHMGSVNAEVELDSYSKNRGFERSVYVEEGSVDGESNNSEKRLNNGKKHDILVKTEWTVERHR